MRIVDAMTFYEQTGRCIERLLVWLWMQVKRVTG